MKSVTELKKCMRISEDIKDLKEFKMFNKKYQENLKVFIYENDKIPFVWTGWDDVCVDSYYWRYLCEPKTKRYFKKYIEDLVEGIVDIYKEEYFLDYRKGNI